MLKHRFVLISFRTHEYAYPENKLVRSVPSTSRFILSCPKPPKFKKMLVNWPMSWIIFTIHLICSAADPGFSRREGVNPKGENASLLDQGCTSLAPSWIVFYKYISTLTNAPLHIGDTVWANQTSALMEEVTPRQIENVPLMTCITPKITTATTTAYTMVTGWMLHSNRKTRA